MQFLQIEAHTVNGLLVSAVIRFDTIWVAAVQTVRSLLVGLLGADLPYAKITKLVIAKCSPSPHWRSGDVVMEYHVHDKIADVLNDTVAEVAQAFDRIGK